MSRRVLVVIGVLLGAGENFLLGLQGTSSLSIDGSGPMDLDATVRISIRVFNLAKVRPATVNRAITESDMIFRKAGVQIKWVECANQNTANLPDCDEPAGPLALNLRVAPRPDPMAAGIKETLFGVAEPYENEGVHATLFYEHIDSFARAGLVPPDLVLAHAMAHELGHLLLWSKSHSPRGIMQASWRKEDLKSIEQGRLAFSSEEVKIMRANLLARQKWYEVIVAANSLPSVTSASAVTEHTPQPEPNAALAAQRAEETPAEDLRDPTLSVFQVSGSVGSAMPCQLRIKSACLQLRSGITRSLFKSKKGNGNYFRQGGSGRNMVGLPPLCGRL